MRRVGGARRKTRHKLKKAIKSKGKINLRRFFQKFQEGENVTLIADSYYQRGMYNRRAHGKVGIVKGMQGNCYKIDVKIGKMSKIMIVHPIHLRKL